MTSQQQARIDADPARTKPTDRTGGGQPSQPHDPRGHDPSFIPTFLTLQPLSCIEAAMLASIDDDYRSSFRASELPCMSSRGEIDAPPPARQERRNEPIVSLDKIYRLHGPRPRCCAARAKRRNEPIVNLDKIHWLCGRDMKRPLPGGKRRNEPNVNLSRFYGLDGIPRFSWLRAPGCHRSGDWLSGRVLARTALHQESPHGCAAGCQSWKRSIEPKPVGARSGRGEEYGTNPTGQSLRVKRYRAPGYAANPICGSGVRIAGGRGTDGGGRCGQDGGVLAARTSDRERLATGWAPAVPSADPRPDPVGGRSPLLQEDPGPALWEPAPAGDQVGGPGHVRARYRPGLGGPGSLAAPPGPVRSPWERGRGRRPAAVRPPEPAAGRRRAPKTGREAP